MAGTAQYPAVLLQVTGQFDPVGTGGENDFSFSASLDTFGQVTLSRVARQGNCIIEQAGNQIDVKLDQ